MSKRQKCSALGLGALISFIVCAFGLTGFWQPSNYRVLIEKPGQEILKQSLRQIVSSSHVDVGTKALDFQHFSPRGYLTQLRTLVGSVLEPTKHESRPYENDGSSASRLAVSDHASESTCGSSCVDALSSRMLALSNLASSKEVSKFSRSRSDRILHTKIKQFSEMSHAAAAHKQLFLDAVHRHIQKAVTNGWKELAQGHRKEALSDLHIAEHYHRTLARILQGSLDVDNALRTPKNIVLLRNALNDAPNRPVLRAFTGSSGLPATSKDRAESKSAKYGRRTPRELQKIMQTNFHSTTPRPVQADQTSLESPNIVAPPRSVQDYSALLSHDLVELSNELDQGHVGAAHEKVKEAQFYLQAIRQGSVHDSDGESEHNQDLILSTSSETFKDRNGANYLETVPRSSIKVASTSDVSAESDFTQDIDNSDRWTHSSERLDSRKLFQEAIRDGTRALKLGNIGKAQGKLAEARYYANSEGFLKVDPTYDSIQRHNAETAKLALKLLAQAILRKESWKRKLRSARISKHDSFRNLLESLYHISNSDKSYAGKLGSISDDSNEYDVSRRHRESFAKKSKSKSLRLESWKNLLQVLEPKIHGDVFAAANGREEEDSLIQHEAKKKQIADCNSLLCLLPTKPSVNHRGPSLERMAGLGGIKKNDFSRAKTNFHTGLHLSKRLEHGGIVPKELQNTDPNARSGSGSLASVSMRDAEQDVLRQEAKDAKKSMSEALVAYKRLLNREVKKEEKNSLTNPMIAIMAPHGHSRLQLTSKEANPAGLKLSPADLLASVKGDKTKQSIINQALSGHSKQDNQLINKYLKMADIDQVQPVSATIEPIPLASLKSLASVQKTFGIGAQAKVDASTTPAASIQSLNPATLPAPPSVASTAPSQLPPPEALPAQAAQTSQAVSRHFPLADGADGADEAPRASRGALASLFPAEIQTGVVKAHGPAAGRQALPLTPAGSTLGAAYGNGQQTRGQAGGGGMVDLLIHDVAQDLGF